MAIKDLTGQKFGRLEVIAFDSINKFHQATWRCKCDCGNECVVSGNCLTQGNTKSCGCLNDEVRRGIGAIPNRTTHGMWGTRLYRIWKTMRNRCTAPSMPSYKYYGKRGISVCEEWQKFENFFDWATRSGYSEDLSIERIDVNKGYSPDNCMWADTKQQARNKTDSKFITVNGESKTIIEWSEITHIPASYLYNHKRKGENVADIISGKTPYRPRKKRK